MTNKLDELRTLSERLYKALTMINPASIVDRDTLHESFQDDNEDFIELITKDFVILVSKFPKWNKPSTFYRVKLLFKVCVQILTDDKTLKYYFSLRMNPLKRYMLHRYLVKLIKKIEDNRQIDLEYRFFKNLFGEK